MVTGITFTIDGTNDDDRKAAPYDFVVVMNAELAKELGLRKYVVILREIHDEDNEEGKKKKSLRVYGVLVEDPELGKYEVRMDQTLRNALGISFEAGRHERGDLKFYPLTRNWIQWWRSFISHFLGRRYLFLRVAKPHPPDIEKNICRVPKDALALLGTAEGNRIVLVSCFEIGGKTGIYALKNYSVKAFDLNEAMAKQRGDEEDKGVEEHGWAARYVKAHQLLNVQPDISKIFLDLHVRHALEVEPGDPMKVRRNFPDLFKQQLLEVGILTSISTITLVTLLPEDLKVRFYIPFVILTVLISIVITCFIIILRLRSRVR